MAKQHYKIEDLSDGLQHGVGNLLDIYSHATRSEWRKGANWYADAYEEACRIASAYAVPLPDVIAVAAILSPQMDWDNNMPSAEDAIRYWLVGGYVPDYELWEQDGFILTGPGPDKWTGGKLPLANDALFEGYCTAYRANQIKAIWYLQGHHDVLSGDKVRSFYDNILYHDSSESVTVDSHAIQAWLGKLEPGTYAVAPSVYAVIAADYRKAASIAGISPLQFQAIVWVVKKRLQDGTEEL